MPQYRAPEQASNPVQTLDFLLSSQVYCVNAPSPDSMALRQVRRAKAYPAIDQNRRLTQSPIDALIDIKAGAGYAAKSQVVSQPAATTPWVKDTVIRR